jgi:dCMP deaminase
MRPTKDRWAIQLATVTAQRATCCRRQVGAVLLNTRGHVLATGYNGTAAGQPHCNEAVEILDGIERDIVHFKDVRRTHLEYPHACPGYQSPSGTNLDGCQAIHAEQNALLQCRDVYAIHTCYVTTSPCMTCVKLLLNTTCERIVFTEEYPHTEARELWVHAGREWERLRD